MSDVKLGNLSQPNFERPEGLEGDDSRPGRAAGPNLSPGESGRSPIDYDKTMSSLPDHVLQTPVQDFSGKGGAHLESPEGGPRSASDWLLEQGKLVGSERHPTHSKRAAADAPAGGSSDSGGGGPNAPGPTRDSLGESFTNTSIDSMPLTDGRLSPTVINSPPANFDANFGNWSGPLPTIANALANAVTNPSSIPSSISNAISGLFNSSSSTPSTPSDLNVSPSSTPPSTPSSSDSYAGPSDAPVADQSSADSASEPGDYEIGGGGGSGGDPALGGNDEDIKLV